MRVAAILAAGGIGARIGGDKPKQFLDLGDGTIMLVRSVDALLACDLIDEVVIALPEGTGYGTEGPTPKPIRIVAGGARRQDSVRNALAAVSSDVDFVAIHDAARPFVSNDLIERTVRAAISHGAAIAAIPVHDTVKRASAERLITATLPRDQIFLAQTPQVFRRDMLQTAIDAAGGETVTDEAALVEQAGYPVKIVEGDASNTKVTTADDLAAARARLAGPAKPARTGRAGTGYDLHRLVEGRPLVIGGVRVPSDRGALGHSDADVVCHAVTDAILGAAGLGDIGRHFPDSDPRWKDADSVALLAQAAAMVAAAGYEVGNLDVTVVLERPKIKDRIDEMRARVAAAAGVDVSRVSIKGKTNEGVDAIGRGEAIAAHAVALIRSRS